MKKNILLAFLISFLIFLSCSNKTNYGPPNVDFEYIKKDYMKWWAYHNSAIKLSSNFIAINDSSNIINKAEFLKKLTSGDFIPLKLISKDSNIYYQLFKLDQTSDKEIRITIKNTSLDAYKYFQMEGKNFPKFHFKDLNGVEYTTENTKGKIVILKCWFIRCASCVAEFPELNDFVKKFKARNDILFISLALDSKDDLVKFLLKKPFDYAVVPDQKDFTQNILKITSFPTHIIIDRNGVIQKVVGKANEMILTFETFRF
jgi:cytochrome oxidase Cu insertion factor (SCO1/SenC/PrrC family)